MNRFKQKINSKAEYNRLFRNMVRKLRSQGLSQNDAVAKAFTTLGKKATGRRV